MGTQQAPRFPGSRLTGKNAVTRLRVLQKGRIQGRTALARDVGHLLAVIYIVCIAATAWAIGFPR